MPWKQLYHTKDGHIAADRLKWHSYYERHVPQGMLSFLQIARKPRFLKARRSGEGFKRTNRHSNQFNSCHWTPPTSLPPVIITTAPVRNQIMNETKTPHFGGGVDEKVNPRDFIKSVCLYFRSHSYTDEKEKVNNLSLFVKTDSEAEKW